jgi:hypothetical protein
MVVHHQDHVHIDMPIHLVYIHQVLMVTYEDDEPYEVESTNINRSIDQSLNKNTSSEN